QTVPASFVCMVSLSTRIHGELRTLLFSTRVICVGVVGLATASVLRGLNANPLAGCAFFGSLKLYRGLSFISPTSGALSTCSKVDHTHFCAFSVRVTTCSPTSPNGIGLGDGAWVTGSMRMAEIV